MDKTFMIFLWLKKEEIKEFFKENYPPFLFLLSPVITGWPFYFLVARHHKDPMIGKIFLCFLVGLLTTLLIGCIYMLYAG